jgi:hypothetical protein
MRLTVVGTISTNIDEMPFVKHKGLLVSMYGNEYILHNTYIDTNDLGGNIVLQDFDRFMVTRYNPKKRYYQHPRDIILNDIDRAKRFNFFTYNCEHFITQFTGTPYSEQLILYCTLAVFILIFIAFIIKNAP